MKKIIIILAVFLSLAVITYAAPTYRIERTLIPEADSTYDLGTSNQAWRNFYIDQICLAGDCQTIWPSGAGGGDSVLSRTVGGVIYAPTTTDALAIGSNSTSTAEFSFDPVGNILRVLTGKVGIGTSTPTNALEVNGSGYFAGNLTAGNITATGTLAVSGHTTLTTASSTHLTVATEFDFLGTIITNVSTWFSGLFDSNLATKDTDDLTQGSTNLYWSNALFDTRLAATTTLPNLTTLAGVTNIGTTQTTIAGKTVMTNASSTNISISGQTYLTGLLSAVNALFSGTLGVTGHTTLTTASSTHLTISTEADLTGAKVRQVRPFTFTYPANSATTTTATSTLSLGFADNPQTFQSIICELLQGSGTLGFVLTDDGSTNDSNTITATSSPGRQNFSANNTFNQDEPRNWEVGPMTAHQFTCTARVLHNP